VNDAGACRISVSPAGAERTVGQGKTGVRRVERQLYRGGTSVVRGAEAVGAIVQHGAVISELGARSRGFCSPRTVGNALVVAPDAWAKDSETAARQRQSARRRDLARPRPVGRQRYNERRSPANAEIQDIRRQGAAHAGECRRQCVRPRARNGR